MTDNNPEFDLIARHFTRPAANAVLGVGDDCALVDVTTADGAGLKAAFDQVSAGRHDEIVKARQYKIDDVMAAPKQTSDPGPGA